MTISRNKITVNASALREFDYCERKFYLNSTYLANVKLVPQEVIEEVDRAKKHLLETRPELTISEKEFIGSSELGIETALEIIVDTLQQRSGPLHIRLTKAKETDDGLRKGDRMQAAADWEILTAQGVQIDAIYFYFFDRDELLEYKPSLATIQEMLEELEGMRSVLETNAIPNPTDETIRCVNCEIVSLCLPDEMKMLKHGSVEVPIRKIAPDDPRRPFAVVEPGSYLRKQNGRVIVERKGEELDSIRMLEISSVSIYGSTSISTPTINSFLENEIPIAFFSFGGWFNGLATAFPNGNIELRRRQFARYDTEEALDFSRQLIRSKIRNSRTILKRNADDLSKVPLQLMKDLSKDALEAHSFESLLGIEGAAAKVYFENFSKMIRRDEENQQLTFDFTLRSRRPPADPVNAMLSYLYSVLIKDLAVISFTVGLEPNLGMFHRTRYNRPALALDMAEEFRSIIVDSLVISLINRHEIKQEHFTNTAIGTALSKEVKKILLNGYERRKDVEIEHPYFGYKITYRRLMEVQMRLFAAWLMGEIETYKPFEVR